MLSGAGAPRDPRIPWAEVFFSCPASSVCSEGSALSADRGDRWDM